MIQANATVFDGDDPRKFEVGARLVFVAYIDRPDCDHPDYGGGYDFDPGEVLVVLERNGCGLGIDVRREPDGLLDMVWPEEVRMEGDA